MDNTPYIRLSELARRIEQVLNQSFGEETFWIVAEISGHKFYPDRDRHYFDLIEKLENSNTETAKVKAKAWELGSKRIALFEKETGEQFRDGLQVLINIKVDYHIVHGLSVTLRDIDLDFTLGKIERQRRETLQKLVTDNAEFIKIDGEHYITRNKRNKLNSVLQRIAIIGSPKSEGYTDFVHTITNNQHQYKFHLNYYYSAVQGAGAEQELVAALISVFNDHQQMKYDCVVMIRGGGSKSDFLVFDTYQLARAAAKFPIPIISGIGHHKDVSILDMMVHTQTKTPTQAAEFIVAHNRSFEESLLAQQKSLVIKVQQTLAARNRQLGHYHTTLVNNSQKVLFHNKDFLMRANQTIINQSRRTLHYQQQALLSFYQRLTARPVIVVGNKLQDLDNLNANLQAFSRKYLANKSGYLGHLTSVINLMSPKNILRKGFAIVSHNDKIVTDGNTFETGSNITITMAEVEIISLVQSKKSTNGKFDL